MNWQRMCKAATTKQPRTRLKVLIGRLRRKVGGDLIETRRGFGYIIAVGCGTGDPLAAAQTDCRGRAS